MISDLTFPDSAGVMVPEALVMRGGRWRNIRLAVRYARFTHTAAGPCLIDTGYSHRVTSGRRSLPLTLYASILRPRLTDHALPDAAPDIRTILLTHLHADHVSALRDYPQARIIADIDAAQHFLSTSAFMRTRHGVFRELLPPDLLDRITPLHTPPAPRHRSALAPPAMCSATAACSPCLCPGICGGIPDISSRSSTYCCSIASDAAWLARAVREARPPGPPARWILDDPKADAETAARLNAFAAASGRIILCHDPAPVA